MSGVPSKDEGLSREQRLRRRADFQQCYRQGRKRHGQLASLHFQPSDLSGARMGITATRKVGNAVVRNLAKRRIREIYRHFARRAELAGVDVVVHLKPEAGRASYGALKADLETLLAAAATSKPRRRPDDGGSS
jgi:ribonuclease P protein component